ncbi:MAG: response regulator transcription factor [Acidimicrobiaceae bacterium]|nr:response regulator transcription factor [Acidimicrobiaceae bacterium]
MRILVAEDDRALRDVLERGLQEAGYAVDTVLDGAAAESALRARDYEVAILDWRMPVRSGVEVIERVRGSGVRTPILLLTARDTTRDRVQGLNAGADDYLIKPFDFAELLARLNALQRRPALQLGNELSCGDLSFDPRSQQCSVSGIFIKLTMTEGAILELLLRRSPLVVTREVITHHAWQQTYRTAASNTIEAHIARLRSKLIDSTAEIQTVRGLGYRVAER